MNLLPLRGARERRWGGSLAASRRFPFLLGTLVVGLSLAQVLVEGRSLTLRARQLHSERDRAALLANGPDDGAEARRRREERLRRLRAVEGRLLRWEEERSLLPALLGELSAVMPDAVVVESLRREEAEVHITGRGGSQEAIAAAAGAFARLRRLQDLELLWAEQADGGAAAGEQRFAFAGRVRYSSPEPPPFEAIELAGAGGRTAR